MELAIRYDWQIFLQLASYFESKQKLPTQQIRIKKKKFYGVQYLANFGFLQQNIASSGLYENWSFCSALEVKMISLQHYWWIESLW